MHAGELEISILIAAHPAEIREAGTAATTPHLIAAT
jgi:hypothetical protein